MRRLGRLCYHLGGGGVGEIQDHQRLELPTFGHMRQDALPITQCICDAQDRRREVGHHNGAARPPGHIRHCRGEGCFVPQVDVPVIRQCQR